MKLVEYHNQAAEAQVIDGQSSSSDVIGLVIVDEDGQITMADAPARQMLHLPTGEIVGMPINGAYPDPEWTKTVDQMLSPSSNGQSSDRVHLSLLFGNESVEADLSTLRGRDGKPDGLAITLRSSESHAERYEAIVSQASEFRTPMTAITGYTDLLLGEQPGILTPIQQQFLERVKANVEQLNHQLNDLVSTASPDFHPIELSPQPVNLIEIIEEAIMGLAARFRERKLIVQLDLPPELGLVKADRDSLYQIMLRLLSNAVLCSKEGTQIVVSASKTESPINGENVCITVTDTGEGIAPEDYSRVFRRFVRANQPLVQGMGETGIGMAVAKTLVEANGGRIWVESQKDVGSSFSFILPVQQDEENS
jgi:signal transduction histidine kinase